MYSKVTFATLFLTMLLTVLAPCATARGLNTDVLSCLDHIYAPTEPEEWNGVFDSKTLFIGDSITYHFITLYLKPNGYIGEASYMAAPCTALSHFFSDNWTLTEAKRNGYGCACDEEFKGLTFAEAVEASAGQYEKVYFMLGSNGSSGVTFEAYKAVTDHLITAYPNATIYLQTLPNCSTGAVRTKKVNDIVAQIVEAYLAEENEKVVKLDTNSIWVKGCIAGDGIHLTNKGLEAWYKFIGENR